MGGRPEQGGLAVSTLVVTGALERRERRGGHTRDDFSSPDPELGSVNLVQRMSEHGDLELVREPLVQMPDALHALLSEEPS